MRTTRNRATLGRSVGLAVAAVGALVTGSFARPATAVSEPGANNAITDVAGLEVGQVQSTRRPYLTGTTVVYAPETAVAGVDVRGSAPGTRETDLLSPINSNPGVNVVVLTGGSAYGLDVADGVMRWLEQRHEGVSVGPEPTEVVPIVPAAVIFDLGRGGGFGARPTAKWGEKAIAAASSGPVRQGTAGAGTGAAAGGLRGGVGTASVVLEDGVVVGALVVVNSAGSAVNPRNCSLLGAALAVGDEFAGLRTPKRSECQPPETQSPTFNTTIGVVATDAALEKGAAGKMASVAHDGIARAINPVHSLIDGDTIFGLSTGGGPRLGDDDPNATEQLDAIFRAAADAMSRAVAHAMLSASSTKSTKSYCDAYPSACAKVDRSKKGSAPEVRTRSASR